MDKGQLSRMESKTIALLITGAGQGFDFLEWDVKAGDWNAFLRAADGARAAASAGRIAGIFGLAIE
jgi:hypothetical protein